MIELDPRWTARDYLETAVHEALHALYPFLDEETVTASAADLARLLWRMGYRLDPDLGEELPHVKN